MAVIVVKWVICVFEHVCDPPKHQAHEEASASAVRGCG